MRITMLGRSLPLVGAIIVSLMGASTTNAQSSNDYMEHQQAAFAKYKSKAQHEFRAYRDRINAEFADYMRHSWPEYKMEPGLPVPSSPEPPVPTIRRPDFRPSNSPIAHKTPTPAVPPHVAPRPVVPLPERSTPAVPAFKFSFYGAECRISLEPDMSFTLAGTTEKDVAAGWRILSSDKYLTVVSECLQYRDRLHLPDWGYVRFVERMTTEFFTPSRLNEARLLQMYILTQSGYKVRIARSDAGLVLLLPSKETIFQYPYVTIGGCRYFAVDTSKSKSLRIFDREFPNEQFFSLRINAEPELPLSSTGPRLLQSAIDKDLSVSVSVNKNLIDFYNDYPLCDNWDIYSTASLSARSKEQLYPLLKSQIADKDKVTAANILLHFVQTAFKYATDAEQFGSERPLFADETLLYPYSDCEDRAILFSVLARELLGTDVVLLHYPGHLASAVCFDNDTPGDYLKIDGKRYVVCDPTFINADVGQAMPQFKQTSAEVIKLK